MTQNNNFCFFYAKTVFGKSVLNHLGVNHHSNVMV